MTPPANPIVELVAEHVYLARNSRPPWKAIAEHRREGYRETVREVLLAAMNAGLIIREIESHPFEEPRDP